MIFFFNMNIQVMANSKITNITVRIENSLQYLLRGEMPLFSHIILVGSGALVNVIYSPLHTAVSNISSSFRCMALIFESSFANVMNADTGT